MVNIVLYAPENPDNTGNIGRTCVVTNTNLHLIKPYGFNIKDKRVRKKGMDYWDKVNLFEYTTIEEFLQLHFDKKIYFASKFAKKLYTNVEYPDDVYIMFGRESDGLPAFIHERYEQDLIRIPMQPIKDARCLNLANSANIILYEALRQGNFRGLV